MHTRREPSAEDPGGGLLHVSGGLVLPAVVIPWEPELARDGTFGDLDVPGVFDLVFGVHAAAFLSTRCAVMGSYACPSIEAAARH